MRKIVYVLLGLFAFVACTDEEGTPFLKPDVSVSEFLDTRDSTVYKCVSVGGQTWMAENFRYMPLDFASSCAGCYSYNQGQHTITAEAVRKILVGTSAPLKAIQGKFRHDSIITGIVRLIDSAVDIRLVMNRYAFSFPMEFYNYSTIKRAIPAPDMNYVARYGALYTVSAATILAPRGWRLPTDEDWKKLESSLGMPEDEIDLLDVWRGDGISRRLKTGEDGIGFDALYAGGRITTLNPGYGTPYFNRGSKAYFWTSSRCFTADSAMRAITRVLFNQNDRILRGTVAFSNTIYYSVRYVKE